MNKFWVQFPIEFINYLYHYNPQKISYDTLMFRSLIPIHLFLYKSHNFLIINMFCNKNHMEIIFLF